MCVVAPVFGRILSTIQILSKYGGTTSLKKKCSENNRKAKVWRSGWALHGIMSITPQGREKEKENWEENLGFKGYFKVCGSGCTKERRQLKVHISWDGTLCCLYLTSPGELVAVNTVSLKSKWQNAELSTFNKGARPGPEWMQPYVFYVWLQPSAAWHSFPAIYPTVSMTISSYLLQERGFKGNLSEAGSHTAAWAIWG